MEATRIQARTPSPIQGEVANKNLCGSPLRGSAVNAKHPNQRQHQGRTEQVEIKIVKRSPIHLRLASQRIAFPSVPLRWFPVAASYASHRRASGSAWQWERLLILPSLRAERSLPRQSQVCPGEQNRRTRRCAQTVPPPRRKAWLLRTD